MDIKISAKHTEALFIYEKEGIDKIVEEFA